MALEPEKAVHQFGYSDWREKRKKVDMKDEEMKWMGSAGESKFDLRKSLAWDTAFFTNPGFLEAEELFHCTRDNQKASAEVKTNKANESNSRSSLAWDSAFLTSEGVLNPVELCLVNKGFNKSEMHLLSAIQELRMSSLSSDTDASSSLETLELQLFEDHQPLPLTRMDGATQPKMKPLTNPRNKQTAHQSQKSSTTPSSKQCSDGSEFNPSYSSSSLKPPKSSGRVKSTEMAPAKRVSLVANEVKPGGKSSLAAGKPRSPLKSSESESDCKNSSHMKNKYHCRDHRVGPKGTSSLPRSNSVAFLSSTNSKPSGIRLPSPKIGYFDAGEARREESENRSKAMKYKSKDCIRNHKMRAKTDTETQAELCVKGKRTIWHKVDKALPHQRQAITTIGDSGDVLIELSTNQGP